MLFKEVDEPQNHKCLHEHSQPGPGNAAVINVKPALKLLLDDKLDNVPIQDVVKECVKTAGLFCNYCWYAVKIAVNGKQLALHLLSEHLYATVNDETGEHVMRKLKNSLDILENMHFNAITYDSSDRTKHIPFGKENKFSCFQCLAVSSSYEDLYAHKIDVHNTFSLLCFMCKHNFFSYSELVSHICPGKQNAESQGYSIPFIGYFRCCFCGVDNIPSSFHFMVHLRKTHHTCDICLKTFLNQWELFVHLGEHKSNFCYRCKVPYGSKVDITLHLIGKHGTESAFCRICSNEKWPFVYHFCFPKTFICEEWN